MLRCTGSSCVPIPTSLNEIGAAAARAPGDYPVPTSGPTGAMLEQLGRVDLVRHTDPAEIAAQGFDKPFFTLDYTFVIP